MNYNKKGGYGLGINDVVVRRKKAHEDVNVIIHLYQRFVWGCVMNGRVS